MNQKKITRLNDQLSKETKKNPAQAQMYDLLSAASPDPKKDQNRLVLEKLRNYSLFQKLKNE